jgi:aconitate hydratase
MNTAADVTLAGASYRVADLPRFARGSLARLPWVLRILLENVLRRAAHDDAESARSILAWLDTGSSNAEIPFHPGRLLMHDTTCVPALVDIAAMRSTLAERDVDPNRLNPVLPVDVSVDHSIAVDRFGTTTALAYNMQRELERNSERYGLMRWATQALHGVRVHPPGTGIMHTLNLERLATVVNSEVRDGHLWAFPDTLIGTDSHTPMINGIGVLAWGVGGLEAESVMFGMPVSLRIPDVIGVRLVGALREGRLATDLALTVTERLRRIDLADKFVEFFGPGVTTLSCGERAVIANMAPEYGASSGFFPIDARTLDYLRSTGRPPARLELVEHYARHQKLWFDPLAEPRYTDIVEIDLSSVEVSIAGPRRPQDRLSPSQTVAALDNSAARKKSNADGAVAIAAITSCTNTSDPRQVIAAGLLARKARALGLSPPAWVKTSFAPGSPTAANYLRRAGLLDDMEAQGFGIVGFGCTTCIGNSGPLTEPMVDAIEHGAAPVAVLSGNRNFPGRVHAQLDANFLASPPLVIAYALAGDVNRDILNDPLGRTATGDAIYLRDIWPSGAEIDAATKLAHDAGDIAQAYDLAEDNREWAALPASAAPLYSWNVASTYIRRPPFASDTGSSKLGRFVAHPLLVLGDDITTDHISPAGQVPANSDAAAYLTLHGENPRDLNVYASRRGNWEVMLRGLYTNKSVRNLLDPELPAGTTIYAVDGAIMPLWKAAERYAAAGRAVVVVAGERYGTGSSRDWAAKGLWLLGVRAVLAQSFERIHRSNLIGMGILPLRLSQRLSLVSGDVIEIDADAAALQPRSSVAVRIRRKDGNVEALNAAAAIETNLDVELLRVGGILPYMLRKAAG